MEIPPTGLLDDDLLYILATQVDDFETQRIAANNRFFQLTNSGEDADGKRRGLGYPEDHPEVLGVRASIDALKGLEVDAVRRLERHMRRSVWGPWLKDAPGVGEKTLARLLAAIGDPYWNALHNRPRRVSELWSFSGRAPRNGVAPAKRKGQKVNWSPEARKRSFVITDSVIKANQGRFREIYDDTKAHYQGAVHQHVCPRCGPEGKPAQPGSPLSKGHIDGRARNAIAKAVLKDLWIEAREIYAERGYPVDLDQSREWPMAA